MQVYWACPVFYTFPHLYYHIAKLVKVTFSVQICCHFLLRLNTENTANQHCVNPWSYILLMENISPKKSSKEFPPISITNKIILSYVNRGLIIVLHLMSQQKRRRHVSDRGVNRNFLRHAAGVGCTLTHILHPFFSSARRKVRGSLEQWDLKWMCCIFAAWYGALDH